MDASTDAAAEAPGGGRDPQLRTARVRIVGWIRPFRGKEPTRSGPSSVSDAQAPPAEVSRPWVSVLKPDGESRDQKAVVTFGNHQEEAATASGRMESYKLDWCYEQEEGISEIFSREVKPLLERVFHGFNASILAYGARDSGKTQLIEGCDEKPGLTFLAMHEILAYGEKNRKEVMISCYEVHQDRVFDLLKLKDQEVQVLEDAGGKVRLKGLSQVSVKSIQDFQTLYYGCNQQTPQKKDPNHVASRRHKGLIIYIPSFHDISNPSLLGRINVIDLAGYEDTKLKKAGPYFTESSKINRSLYALQNVVSALHANDGRVPYRDNKLTHLLKDFIGRESQALMITCLKPTPCPDTIQVVSTSSRSCLSVNSLHLKSVKKKSGQRPIPWHSPSSDQQPIRQPSGREKTFSISMKKPGMSRLGPTPNKAHVLQCPSMARKLFNTRVPAINSVQDKHILSTDAIKELPAPEEKENSTLSSSVVESSLPEEDNSTCIAGVLEISVQGDSASNIDVLEHSIQESFPSDEQSYLKNADIVSQVNVSDIQDCSMEQKHISLDIERGSSPPISERLREISNSLKLLSCQPLSITSLHEKDGSCTRRDGADSVEPRTPLRQLNGATTGMWDAGKSGTPKETFKTRSAGLKNSLVQECLTFLNSASKEELRELKGVGEKRLSYILELREEKPEPFKELNDLQQIGLTPKQAKGLVRNVVSGFFH